MTIGLLTQAIVATAPDSAADRGTTVRMKSGDNSFGTAPRPAEDLIASGSTPWRLISWNNSFRRLVSDHCLIASGSGHGARMQLARSLTSLAGRAALAANEQHDSRVHLIAPLPCLIHCSHVPRLL